MPEMLPPLDWSLYIQNERDPASLSRIVEAGEEDPSHVEDGAIALELIENMVARGYKEVDPIRAEEAFEMAEETLNSALSTDIDTVPSDSINPPAFNELRLWKVFLPALAERRMKGALSTSRQEQFRTDLAGWLDGVKREKNKPLIVMGTILGGIALMDRDDWFAYPLPNRRSSFPRYIVETPQDSYLAIDGGSARQEGTVLLRDSRKLVKACSPETLATYVSAALRNEQLSPEAREAIMARQQLYRNRVKENEDAITPAPRLLEVRPTGSSYDTYKHKVPEQGFPLALAEDVDPDTLLYYPRRFRRSFMWWDISRGFERAIACGDEQLFTETSKALHGFLEAPSRVDTDQLVQTGLWDAFMPAFLARVRREPLTSKTIIQVGKNMAKLFGHFYGSSTRQTDDIVLRNLFVPFISLNMARKDPRWMFYPSFAREGFGARDDNGTSYRHNGYFLANGRKVPVLLGTIGPFYGKQYDPVIEKIAATQLDGVSRNQMGKGRDWSARGHNWLYRRLEETAILLNTRAAGLSITSEQQAKLDSIEERLRTRIGPALDGYETGTV